MKGTERIAARLLGRLRPEPRLISTIADFFEALDSGENVKLSPELQAFARDLPDPLLRPEPGPYHRGLETGEVFRVGSTLVQYAVGWRPEAPAPPPEVLPAAPPPC